MKNCAIICEYNPMHSGHVYQIEQTRKKTGCDNIIAIMSGSFTQRGIPAIYDKWSRTEAALKNGVDMVIELPAVFATTPAEKFAMGGVLTANSLGIIDTLSFGCEIVDMDILYEIANELLNESCAFKKVLKDFLNTGLSLAAAREKALEEVLPQAKGVLKGSNTILAIEYIKALIQTNSSIKPVAIKRTGQDENDPSITSSFPSAFAIRSAIYKGESLDNIIPSNISNIFKNKTAVFNNMLYTLVRYKLLSSNIDELFSIADVSEGLENKMLSAALSANSTDDLINTIKSKRYTYARISRILTSLLLGITKKTSCDACNNIEYVRVLGVKKEATYLLSELSKHANAPVITNPKNCESEYIKYDILASDIHSILENIPAGRDYTEKLISI